MGNASHFSVGPGGASAGSVNTGTFTLNKWTHVAAQVVNGHHQYYVNGEDAGIGGNGTVLPEASEKQPTRISIQI